MNPRDLDATAASLLTRLQRAGMPLHLPLVSHSVQPEAGQLWRARWDDLVMLVLIEQVTPPTDTDDSLAIVAAASINVEEADEASLVVPGRVSGFTLPLTVWPNVVTTLPFATLEQHLATLPIPRASVTATAVITQNPQVRTGTVSVNPASAVNRARDSASLTLQAMSQASVLPVGEANLPELLGSLSPTQVADALGVSVGVGLKVLRGSYPLTFEQSETLAALIRSDARMLFTAGAAVPAGLHRALTRVDRGWEIRALARERHVLDSAVLGQVARSALALAARGDTGPEPDWEARLDRAVQAVRAS